MPPRRLVAVLVCALAVVLYVALRTGTTEVGVTASGASEPRSLSPSEPRGIALDGDRIGAAALPDRVALVEADESSAAPELPAPLAAPEGGLLVRVVGEDGAPLAGVPVALVASLDAARSRSVVRARTRAPDGLAVLSADLRKKEQAPGVSILAAIGLPISPRVARSLDGWIPGEPWNGGTIELVLPEAARAWLAPLRVEVVDSAGRPAGGAEVAACARPRLAGADASELARARTRAPDGVAELDREPWIEWIERAQMMQHAFDLEVRCRGPFRVEPSTAFDLSANDAPVRVELPPTGALSVRLEDLEGLLVARQASVGLYWYEPGATQWLDKRHVRVEGGVARFEHVGLGLEISVSASLAGGAASAPSVRRAGPAREGELVEVVLAFGPEHPRLVGRFVDEHGLPAASMLFWLAGRPLAADAEGRFSIPWPAEQRATAVLRFEERSHPKLGAPKDWVSRWAEVPFPPANGDGRFDAGDVVLREVPVVLAGRVVDAGGAPLRQAWLLVQRTEDESDASAWENLKIPGVSRASTRDDGTFELRSLDPARALRVSASWKKLSSPTVIAAPGTRGLELVVEEGEDFARTRGRVTARVEIEPEVPWHWIEVALEDESGRDRTAIPFAGAVTFDKVPPGTYRLELRTLETRWPLLAIEGVTVAAGEAASDPRLLELDLRSKTRVWRVRLEDAAGQPLARKRVRLGKGSLSTDAEGRLAFLAPVELATVRLEPRDHAELEAAWSQDEQRVVVE